METAENDIEKAGLESIEHAVMTHVGMRREENQDSYGVIENSEFKLFIVADGMGGVSGGAIASKLAIDVVKAFLAERENVSDAEIVCAIGAANQAIYERGLEEPTLSGMGTTLVGLCFRPGRLSILNVGDSRAYLFRDGHITQLTKDHTLISELLKTGAISEDQVENHPVAHMLTRSLGPTTDIDIDCSPLQNAPLPNDRYLLCSDGLYNHVNPDDMAAVLTDKKEDEAVAELIELANSRGGSDNITVMVVSVPAEYAELPQDDGSESLDSFLENGFDPLAAIASQDEVINESPKSQEQGEVGDTLSDIDTLDNVDTPSDSFRENFGKLDNKRDEDLSINPSVGTASADALRQKLSNKIEQETPRNLKSPGSGNSILRYLIVIFAVACGTMLVVWFSVPAKEQVAKKSDPALEVQDTGTAPVVAPKVFDQVEIEADNPPSNKSARGEEEPNTSIDSTVVFDTSTTEDEEEIAFDSASKNGSEINQEPQGEQDSLADAEAIQRRIKALKEKEAKIEQKIASFDEPLTGSAPKLLQETTSGLNAVEQALKKNEEKLQDIKEAIGTWYGQQQRLQSAKVLQIANEMASQLPLIEGAKKNFESITWKFLKKRDAFKYEPDNKELEAEVQSLVKQRKQALEDLEISIRDAIAVKLKELDAQSTALAGQKEELLEKLKEAQDNQMYAQALVSQDPVKREASRTAFSEALDTIRSERESLEALLVSLYETIE